MGMSVKGETEHRLVRRGAKFLLDVDGEGRFDPPLTEQERQSCQILVRRADLALDRIKKRKARRAATYVGHLAAMPQRTGDQPV